MPESIRYTHTLTVDLVDMLQDYRGSRQEPCDLKIVTVPDARVFYVHRSLFPNVHGKRVTQLTEPKTPARVIELALDLEYGHVDIDTVMTRAAKEGYVGQILDVLTRWGWRARRAQVVDWIDSTLN